MKGLNALFLNRRSDKGRNGRIWLISILAQIINIQHSHGEECSLKPIVQFIPFIPMKISTDTGGQGLIRQGRWCLSSAIQYE